VVGRPRPRVVEWQEPECISGREWDDRAEVSLVERRDVRRSDASRQRNERRVGQPDPERAVPIGDIRGLPWGARPPVDPVGTSAHVIPECAHGVHSPSRRGQVVGFCQDERCRHQFIVKARVPVASLAVQVVGSVEQGVDDRCVENDHSMPKPVSAR